ncbi:hypothetical protein OIU84_005244 [Salix udensis]|uniref:AMP-dependent synthetase/ligase domain-containing protein n=1 Tax=Salix udensis TaxID=889485 RepID=A0AAD6JVY3_9ROSI|nr:hypothetical protein OIU84_005244 [Salix udensis]
MNYENYDPSFPDQPVVDLYLPVWANLPPFRSKPAFIWVEDGSNGAAKSSTIIYAQLNESAHSISTRLLTQLQRGDTVVILCSPGLELVQIIFGCKELAFCASQCSRQTLLSLKKTITVLSEFCPGQSPKLPLRTMIILPEFSTTCRDVAEAHLDLYL